MVGIGLKINYLLNKTTFLLDENVVFSSYANFITTRDSSGAFVHLLGL